MTYTNQVICQDNILKNMNKLAFLCFLLLLVLPLRTAAKDFLEDYEVGTDVEDWEVEEDDDGDNAEFMESWKSRGGNKVLVNVDAFGAAGDGVSDDTQVKTSLYVL